MFRFICCGNPSTQPGKSVKFDVMNTFFNFIIMLLTKTRALFCTFCVVFASIVHKNKVSRFQIGLTFAWCNKKINTQSYLN